MRELVYGDFLDIALGGTILGTGGGGSYSAARSIAERVLRRRRIRLISLGETPASATVASTAAMGSPEAMLKTPFTTEARSALSALEMCSHRKFGHVLPIETSGYNILACMTACLGRDLTVVDADGAGRSIPRLGQTLFHAYGIPFSPFALADAKGRSISVAAGDFVLEERTALDALEYFGWLAGLACFPMTGTQAKRASVPGTISLAQRVGAAVREVSKSGGDVLETVLTVSGGTELIRGKISGIQTETDGSYTFGTLKIRGTGGHSGSVVSVKSMNENMIAWRDGKLVAVAPDRICYIRPDGQPVTNADVSLGESIDIFVIDAQRQWKTGPAAGLFAETLKAMGYTEPDASADS
jgi:uncharacterized protein